MIDQTDRHLAGWIGGILDQVEVSLDPPRATEMTLGVGLYLMELVQSPSTRGARLPPLLMKLRYLVTTHAPKPEEAHKMLGTLVIAALENPEFEVEQEPLPPTLWTALGIPPRPAFVLRVPFKHERPQKLAPPVKQAIVLKPLPCGSLEGQILGPENIPLMNARVELPALELSTSTDSKGRFYFSSVPSPPGTKLLRVRAKGQEFSVNIDPAGTEPLVIHLQLEG